MSRESAPIWSQRCDWPISPTAVGGGWWQPQINRHPIDHSFCVFSFGLTPFGFIYRCFLLFWRMKEVLTWLPYDGEALRPYRCSLNVTCTSVNHCRRAERNRSAIDPAIIRHLWLPLLLICPWNCLAELNDVCTYYCLLCTSKFFRPILPLFSYRTTAHNTCSCCLWHRLYSWAAFSYPLQLSSFQPDGWLYILTLLYG